jgi:hypothetical protein
MARGFYTGYEGNAPLLTAPGADEMPEPLPPCGLYRTTTEVGEIPAGRLVYFHNHGDPGPGLYLPETWAHNRARFAASGHTMPEPVARNAASLEPLPVEGFYRVVRAFFCCAKKCREFEENLFVQLGYNGSGEAILFVPELNPNGMALPVNGSLVDRAQLAQLALVKVARREDAAAEKLAAPGGMLH